MAKENPTWGQRRVAAELYLKPGLLVSPRTVRKYWPWGREIARVLAIYGYPRWLQVNRTVTYDSAIAVLSEAKSSTSPKGNQR